MKARCLPILLLLTAGLLQGAELRVMTWDIEDAYPSDKFPILAKVVRQQRVDILALQNVQTKQDRVHQTIQKELDKLFGKGVFRHRITTAQRFDGNAVYWNSKTVQLLDASEDMTIRMKKPGQRPAQIFRGKSGRFEFFLVNVNLYEGLDSGESLKLEQAAALRGLIGKLRKNAPVILAGNLQMGFPDEKIYSEISDSLEESLNPAYARLNPDGFLKFCTRELVERDPQAFSYVGDVLEGGRLTDHIAASPDAWKRYSRGSARIIRVDQDYFDGLDDYEWNFSEHLPVVAEFKTN